MSRLLVLQALLALLAAILAPPAMAGQPKPVKIGDKEVIVTGKGEALEALVEVRGLTIYEAKLADTGKPCSVVSGFLVSRLPHANYTVKLTLEVQNSRRGLSGYGFSVPVEVTVDCPAVGRPVKFTGCGPRWYTVAADGGRDPRDTPTYKVTVNIEKAKVPKLD